MRRTSSWIVLAVLFASSAVAIAGAQSGGARARCEARCAEQHAGDSDAREDCVLSCPPPEGLSPVERCRFECSQQSRRCDRGCRAEVSDGARRGCLRRCGSAYHVSCPHQCERDPDHDPPL